MKSKQLKKVLAMLLVFTIMAGTLVIRVDAITTSKTYNISLWSVNVGGMVTTTTATAIPLNLGDSLDVNLVFKPWSTFPYIPQNVDFGLVDDAGVFHYFELGMGGRGNSINIKTAVMAGREGFYRFRVRNRLPVPVDVTGTFTYRKDSKVISDKGGLGTRAVTISCGKDSTVSATQWTYDWLPAINYACNSWNNAGCGVSIHTTQTLTSPHLLNVGSYPGERWDGLCTRYPAGNVVATSSKIDINTTGPAQMGNPTTDPEKLRWRKVTILHEFGHLLWLNDLDLYSRHSIMSPYLYNTSVVSPQQYDINNVNFLYG